MPVEFTSLLENLNLTTPMMIDSHGNEINTVEAFKAYHEFYKIRRDRGLIPSEYERPLGAQLELTYRCNQHCLTCYNRSGGDKNQWESMTKDEWIGIAKQLVDLGIFQCVISGGEPLLMGEDLFEIMDVLHESGIKFIFITNGMLLSPEKVEKLSKYRYDWSQVSIDGSRPEIHNHIRGVDSWHKAIRGAALIHEAGIPLVLAHVVVKNNFDLLEEMIDLAYVLGANQILVGPIEYSGRATDNYEELALTDRQKKEMYPIVKRKYCQYAKRLDVRLTLDEVMAFRYRTVESNGVMLIRPNGDVKFDCVLPYIIGNVRENSVKEIWEDMGSNVYEHPTVAEFISKICSEKDIMDNLPDIDSDTVYLKKKK